MKIKEEENRDTQMIFPPPMDQNFNHIINILIFSWKRQVTFVSQKLVKSSLCFSLFPGICEGRIACSVKLMFIINNAAGCDKDQSKVALSALS